MMDIDEMRAGRELDMLVAEKAMGWKYKSYTVFGVRVGNFSEEDTSHTDLTISHYSTDIADAWRVVERLATGMTQFRLEQTGNGLTLAKFFDCRIDKQKVIGGASADTAPLAICRAALKAVGMGD